ncbi:MAG: hypothetical protein J5845_04700 [Lachnospiraceae bacterium]|nr:hypothetical protein [Lachnospiraceae bacterium]
MEQDETRLQKNKKLRIQLIILAAALVLVGVLFYLRYVRPYIEKEEKIRRYNQGLNAVRAGEYEEAVKIFDGLGSYRRSAYMVHFSETGVTYMEGKDAMNAGDYVRAQDCFLAASGFRDSYELYDECKKAAAYERAVSYLREGRYYEARSSLQEAGDYPDIEDVGVLCGRALAAEDVKSLMETKQFAEAYAILTGPYAEYIPEKDREEFTEFCLREANYALAVKYFGERKYYSASVLFEELGTFRYSKRFLDNCTFENPDNGETYRNPKYEARTDSCRLTIKPPEDDNHYNFVKVYAVDYEGREEIACCVFIDKGRTATILLPAGKYSFNVAYANDDAPWFGEVEMFGSYGTYARMKASADSDVFTLTGGRKYTLKLRTE